MTVLSIDIETYSSVDLKECGVYRYVEADDFEILLFAYAFDDEPVQVIDLYKDDMPNDILKALNDPKVIKTAFNANFERTCIAKHFNIPLPPEQWRCTQVHALTLGLPFRLANVAKALNLDVQKDGRGESLIRFFSIPCKPTESNGQRTRNLPHHAPDKWKDFIEYCRQDVVVEREIRKRLEKHPMLKFENELWAIDQRINDRGVYLDTELVSQAIQCGGQYQVKLESEAKRITGLENPNSVQQLKKWLEQKTGLTIDSLTKDSVKDLFKNVKSDEVKRVLQIRQQLSKTSIKKYWKMQDTVCKDGRIRGLLQFYGASRAGRWAGRLVQVQNLPRNSLPDLELARELLRSGDFETIEMLYKSVPDVLSQLIRTAFIPSPGNRFIVSDFSSIEARVIAWLAEEKWRLDVFRSHGKIYEASASQMFGVPIESITKGSPLRQKGKIAELALGYQGHAGALIQMGALEMGLSEDELIELVNNWRATNPKIVKFWYDTEAAAIKAVKGKQAVGMQHGLIFSYEDDIMFIRLPSGRRLAYVRPRIETDRFGKEKLTYEGMGSQSAWGRIDTYGGKLVENIVQGVARDCLAVALTRLHKAGYTITFHVHDEVVLEMPHGKGSVEEVEAIMSEPIIWARDLPLAAEGFETDFYKKD